jgi:hypothetical protein
MARRFKKSKANFINDKPVARMKVSIAKKSIIETESDSLLKNKEEPDFISNDSSGDSSKTSTSKALKKKKRSKELVNAVDSIWEYLNAGNIDLGYAIVGYAFSGRAILDHDIFVNLLINYGFKIDVVLAFIDDFNEVSLEDDDFPIVMISSHMQKIYEEINNLEECPTKNDETQIDSSEK